MFRAQRLPVRPSPDAILQTVATAHNLPKEKVLDRSSGRAFKLAVYLLRRRGNLTLGEVATLAGVSVSRVSQIQAEIEAEETDGRPADVLMDVTKELTLTPLGAEDSQLQTEAGVRRYLTLVFVVNSLLKSLDLSQPIGDLPMTEFQDVVSTFGQRCRRILLEVFHDLIQTIARWLKENQMTPSQVFELLFNRLLYV